MNAGVATLLVESGITDVNIIQAALLHDTVEDTQTTHEELVQVFGAVVAGIVAEVFFLFDSLPSAGICGAYQLLFLSLNIHVIFLAKLAY